MKKKLRRVTIMLEEELEKKLHILQGNKIVKLGKTVSFSEILNDVLRKSLR